MTSLVFSVITACRSSHLICLVLTVLNMLLMHAGPLPSQSLLGGWVVGVECATQEGPQWTNSYPGLWRCCQHNQHTASLCHCLRVCWGWVMHTSDHAQLWRQQLLPGAVHVQCSLRGRLLWGRRRRLQTKPLPGPFPLWRCSRTCCGICLHWLPGRICTKWEHVWRYMCAGAHACMYQSCTCPHFLPFLTMYLFTQ